MGERLFSLVVILRSRAVQFRKPTRLRKLHGLCIKSVAAIIASRVRRAPAGFAIPRTCSNRFKETWLPAARTPYHRDLSLRFNLLRWNAFFKMQYNPGKTK